MCSPWRLLLTGLLTAVRMNGMSVVEDVRQVLQDFLTPELRALAGRMDNLEKRFDTFERAVDARLANQDKLAEARHSEIDAKLISLEQKLLGQIQRLESRFDSTDAKIEQLIHTLDINRRLAKLEAQTPAA